MHLAPGLTPESASRICRHECRAQCCRGPLVLRLAADEVGRFRAQAKELQVELVLHDDADGSGSVAFPAHAGEHCPMLDGATSVCRIYPQRPARCRDFPDRPRPGCAISGGVPAP